MGHRQHVDFGKSKNQVVGKTNHKGRTDVQQNMADLDAIRRAEAVQLVEQLKHRALHLTIARLVAVEALQDLHVWLSSVSE